MRVLRQGDTKVALFFSELSILHLYVDRVSEVFLIACRTWVIALHCYGGYGTGPGICFFGIVMHLLPQYLLILQHSITFDSGVELWCLSRERGTVSPTWLLAQIGFSRILGAIPFRIRHLSIANKNTMAFSLIIPPP